MNARSLANLSVQAPAAYELLRRSDLLRRVGLERRRSQARRAASCASLLGLGAVLGGAAALLLSPRNGAEMRERLGNQARRARNYMKAGDGSAATSARETSASRSRSTTSAAASEY